MSSDKDYCKPIDGDNYGVELSYEKELKEAIEEAKKANRPLVLYGPRFSGKTNALKRAIFNKLINKDQDCIIEIPKSKIDKDKKEELKQLINGNRFIIIEGTKHEVEYILSDETYEETDKLEKLKEYLEKAWKALTKREKEEDLETPEGVQKVKAYIEKEEAYEIFNFYVDEYIKKHEKVDREKLEKKKVHLIEMAYLGKKGEGIFIPQYLKRLIEEYAEKSEEELKSKKEEEKEKEEFLLGFFGIKLVDIIGYSNNVLSFLESLLPYFQGRIQIVLNAVLSHASVIITGLTLLSAFQSKDKNKAIEQFIKAYQYWNGLPQEKREALCSLLDEKYYLPPGSSYAFLSSWLSMNEIELRKKLTELINEIYPKIKEIEEELEKLKEGLYASGTIGIRSERELAEEFKSRYGVAINEETIVGIRKREQEKEISSKADEVIINKALEIINKASNKLVLIVGEPGVGKSTLLYIIGRELLNQIKRVYLIDDIGRFSFSEFLKLGDDAYAILDVTEKIDPNRVLDRISDALSASHVIIAIRSTFIKNPKYSENLEKKKDIVEIYEIKTNSREFRDVLLEIAKRNLEAINSKGLLTHKQIDQIASELVEKSEGLPLYITEAMKKISLEIEKKNINDIINSLPEGIKALILNIIDAEMSRLPYLLLLYYLVAHCPNFPKELISSAETLLNIPRPIYMNELPEEGTYTLHSWYKDITDLIFQGKFDKLEFRNVNKEKFLEKVKSSQYSRFIKVNANDYIKSIRKTLGKQKCILVNLNEKIFPFIEHLGATVPLIDLADAIMLFLIFDAVSRELVNRDTGYGFMIDKERVDPTKLDEKGYKFYNKLVGFIINTYLKDLREDELLNRPFYALSILYISRLLTGDLPRRIDKEFLRKGKPSLTLNDIAESYLNSSKLLQLYISAFVSFLESIGYIRPQSEFEKATLLFCKGRFEEAIKEFDKTIQLNPNNPGYQYNKALALKELNRYEEAIKEFDKTIQLDPDNPDYHNAKGIVLDGLGRFEEALEEFEKAIQLEPSDPYYYNNKGNLLAKLKKYDEAIREFDKAIILNPFDPRFYYNKGNALEEKGQYGEVLEEFEIAIRLDPNNSEYHNNKGRVLEKLGLHEEAIKEYDIAIELDPNNPEYYYNKALALCNLGRYEDSIKELDKAIELDPDEPFYHHVKGDILFDLERYDEAIKEYDKAIELDPDEPANYYNKALALKELNRFKEAIEAVEKALSLLPGEPSYLVLYEELWAYLNSPEKGIIKIRDSVTSGETNRNELCEEIDSELEEDLNEKERKVLSDIKNDICLKEGNKE